MFCFDDITFDVLSRYMFRCTEVCFGDNSSYTCMFLAKYKQAGQVQVDQENMSAWKIHALEVLDYVSIC